MRPAKCLIRLGQRSTAAVETTCWIDLRCLEGLREFVAKLALRVDGEDARDWDSDGAVRVDVLKMREIHL